MIRLLSRILFMTLWIPVIGISQTAVQTAAAQTGKIVWVNMETAVFSCDEGKNEFTEIQKFVDAKNDELNGLKKESDSLKNQLSVQGAKLTDDAAADLQYQITVKDTDLKRFSEDTQREINNKKDRAAGYIIKRMQVVIDKLAREKGLGAILNMDPNRDVWIDPALDFTEELVKAYNGTYPVSKAKAPAPPANPGQ
jgi:outer membrane protein